MINQIYKITFLLGLFAGCTFSASAQQQADSLSFQDVMARVIQSHPSVKEAEEVLNGAKAK